MGYKYLKSNEWMGVILCGGRSSKKGIQKGLMKKDDLFWTDHCIKLMDGIISEKVLSVNENQYSIYRKNFQNYELIVDSQKLTGPTAGILSVYIAYRVYNLLALAVDMIDMKSELVKMLYDAVKVEPGHEFYVFERNGIPEPFCGVYTTKGLQRIYEECMNGEIYAKTLSEILKDSDTYVLQVPKGYETCFHSSEKEIIEINTKIA
jgi:molybdenum cofactor guanylyltransferase